jgi:hypothetical protein
MDHDNDNDNKVTQSKLLVAENANCGKSTKDACCSTIRCLIRIYDLTLVIHLGCLIVQISLHPYSFIITIYADVQLSSSSLPALFHSTNPKHATLSCSPNHDFHS